MNFTCPNCKLENAYLETVSEETAYYCCPDCDFEWEEDLSVNNEDKGRLLKHYEECPNCSEGDNRWIYECSDCGFTGCYDEVYENGCYQGDEEVEQCPECGSYERVKIGKVGRGTSEE
ncbi:MAG: hypothetical protein QM725_12010 [Lacibacter sp.]